MSKFLIIFFLIIALLLIRRTYRLSSSDLGSKKNSKKSTFHGSVYANDSSFSSVKLCVSMALYGSEVQNLCVKALNNSVFSRIELKNSVVMGNIEFASKGGQVILYGNSHVKGKVVNGVIIQK